MSEPWGISIIIVNFNYECSLPAAIDSALSQKHRFRRFANRRTTP
jgi:glycosyltransferase involved in cell wall biosynthesis